MEFVVYEPADCQVGAWFDTALNVTSRRTPLPSEGRLSRLLKGKGYWRMALPKERFDLFEGFNLPLISAPSGQTLLSIHDIRGMYSTYGELESRVYKILLSRAISRADHVITVTVSETLKQEILDVFPKTPISVIYNGIDVAPFVSISDADLQNVRCRYYLPNNFVLTVGHLRTAQKLLASD